MKKCILSILLVSTIASVIAQAPYAFNYQAVIRNEDGTVLENEPVSVQINLLQGRVYSSSVYMEVHNTQTNEFGLVNLVIGEGTTSDDLILIDWSDGPYFIEVIVNGKSMDTSQLLSVPYAIYSEEAGNVFSGDYDDLSDVPSDFQPSAHTHLECEITNLQHYSDADIDGNEAAFDGWDKNVSDDFSGVYNDLEGKPANIDEDRTDDVTLTGDQKISGEKTFFDTIRTLNGIDANNTNLTSVADPINNQDAATKAYVDELKRELTELKEILLLNNDFLWLTDTTGIFRDLRDNNTYNFIKIDDQVWMQENLAYLPAVSPPALPSNYDPLYYVYGYQGTDVGEAIAKTNYDVYGVLYNWPAAMEACPAGWHLPSDAEWGILATSLDNTSFGGKLKEAGIAHWASPNAGATNESGFTALPGGYRHSSGSFVYKGTHGDFWTSSESSDVVARWRGLLYDQQNLSYGAISKQNGFSVRCVMDSP